MAKFVYLEEADQYLNLDLVWLVGFAKQDGKIVAAKLEIVGQDKEELLKGKDANNLATHLRNLGKYSLH